MTPKSVALSALLLVLAGTHVQAQACDTQGLIEPVGQGTPGTFGVPLLDTVGVPLLDKAFWLELTGGLPGAHGCIIGSLNEAALELPFFGATFYPAEPIFVEVFDLDGSGQSVPLFPLPTVPDLCGAEFVSQTVVLDPLAQGGAAFSRAMRVRFGGPATGPLFLLSNYPVGDRPRSVAVGDLNGDGVPDLVSANENQDDASVLLGTGAGGFGAPQSYPVGDQPSSVAIDDVDGDEILDLAVANQESGDVSILLGLGDGTFGPAQSYPTNGRPQSVAIDDLNGDAAPDLVVAAFFSGGASVLLGTGDGSFGAAQGFPAGGLPRCVVTGDLDGDGVPDLAVANQDSDDVSVLLGVGDGT